VAALEELGPPPPATVQPLTALVANPDTNIAYWSATLLGRLGSNAASAVDALGECLSKHPEMSVRQRAAWALGEIGPSAKASLPALEQAAAAGDARLARLARKAIEQIKTG
jgi:HEAT repeat protein